mgnify:FL=1
MKKKLAFTLIEILIAISVFAIGILAVLRVLTGNLSTLDTANIKLQATVLAKEWIELLYNVRDSNLEKNLSWDCVMNNEIYDWSSDILNNYLWDLDNPEDRICEWKFWISQILKLSFDKDNYLYQKLEDKQESFGTLFRANQLCLFSWDDMYWYAYCDANDWGEETIFARYLSFSPVYIDAKDDSFEMVYPVKSDSVQSNTYTNVLPNDKILKVESHVLYDKSWKTWDIVFESFIWNY